MIYYKTPTAVPRHYFNDIPYTKWPFFIGSSLFSFIFFFILYLNKYSEVNVIIVLIPLLCMVYYMME